MNAQRQTNTFVKGMNMDLDYSIIDSSQYNYSENIRIIANDDSSTGVMQNIEGFIKLTPTTTLFNEEIVHINTIRDWAIVFTKKDDNFNIYRYDFGASETNPVVTTIASDVALDIPTVDGHYAVSSVCRWESDEYVKIYWCDGEHQIRVLNVAETYTDLDADSLNIAPKGQLPPLMFYGIGSGGLLSGKYQYAYQLFNPRGSETSLSVLSPIIYVSAGSNALDSQSAYGSSSESNSGKSIILQTTLNNTDFSMAKIIQLYYASNTTEPVITVIDEVNLTGTTLYYEDKGGSVIDELTLEEFNGLSTYLFIPRILESKEDTLFAANITEQTWDITEDDMEAYSFDPRAFRCDQTGNIRLLSNSSSDYLEFNISDLGSDIVKERLKQHDCICPANTEDDSEYIYTRTATGTYVPGGIGTNVSYRFLITKLIESDATPETSGYAVDNYSLNAGRYSTTNLMLYYPEDTSTIVNTLELQTGTSGATVLNYSNSEIESKVRGYMRDEIYRFAIVFYNDENVASSAHWIADIRMPKISRSGYEIFSSSARVDLSQSVQTDLLEVVTHPLGIEFTINIPSNMIRDKNITGYEIVRCERTISDRTIIAQGVVSQTCVYEENNTILVALPYLSWSSIHGLISQSSDYAHIFQFSDAVSSEYFIFVSPEICVNRENAAELVEKANQIEGLYKLRSRITPDDTLGDGEGKTGSSSSTSYLFTKLKIMAGAKTVYPYDSGQISTSGQKYSRDDGWSYSTAYAYDSESGNQEGQYIVRIDGDYCYNTALAKYYNKVTVGTFGTADIQDIVIATETDPFDYDDDAWMSKPTNVGSVVFYNWSYSPEEGAGSNNSSDNIRKEGPHGLCAVFQSSNMRSANPFVGQGGVYDRSAGPEEVVTVLVANLKQSITPYGGNSYSNRQNSTYISTGTYVDLVSNPSNNYSVVFGGDTYVGVLDYAITMQCFNNESDNYAQSEYSRNRAYIGAYIPIESSINLSMRTDQVCVSKSYEAGTGYSNHYAQNNIVQIGTLYAQSTPLYAYNDAYSAEPIAKTYTPRSVYSIDNLHTDTRVMNSEVKTNLEVTDSWTKFAVANYLDVDTRFGSINNMKLFNNNLLFWQTDAFGTLAVNERSLIQDNNPGALTLGTGDVLARFDYLTTKNGSKENQLRVATQSDSTVYWYDYDRNEICGFDGQLQTVSKLKGVQSYLHDNKDNFTLDPIAVYDKKYNEVLFTLEDKTLAFNEQLGAFTSFYTFTPDWWAEFSDRLFIYNSLAVYKYNAGDDVDMLTGTDKVAYIKFIVNENYQQTKTFDNVEYAGDFTYGTNFDDVYFETKRQTSYTLTQDDIDYREDTYKFCIPRNNIELSEIEQLVNKSYRDRMKGKYLVCHYKYDCNGGNTFKVPYISTAYRNSLI